MFNGPHRKKQNTATQTSNGVPASEAKQDLVTTPRPEPGEPPAEEGRDPRDRHRAVCRGQAGPGHHARPEPAEPRVEEGHGYGCRYGAPARTAEGRRA